MAKINFVFRTVIQLLFWICSYAIQFSNCRQRKSFKKNQRVLSEKLELKNYAVSKFEDQYPRLLLAFTKQDSSRRWVQTSGTRNVPKQIPYDKDRLEEVQKVFLKAMITITSPYSGHKTFFAMASMDEDQTLTSGMIHQSDPHHIELIQAPYRYLQTEAGREMRKRVGDLTARVALLLITRPRFLYANNPSTISYFLKCFDAELVSIQLKIKSLLSEKHCLEKALFLADGDALKRLQLFAEGVNLPWTKTLFPELKAIITWQGGYVAPFLEQVKEKIPWAEQLPMYSMSTEVIETLPHRMGGKLSFLPTARGVVYEFMDESGTLFKAHELTEGSIYTLVISDIWGMRRYDTLDLFLVKDRIDGLPDLHFMKRRGLNVSLTGEKLTEEQIQLLSQKLKEIYKEASSASLSVYPVMKGKELGYELTVISSVSTDSHQEISTFLKQEILKINSELRSKIESGRLAPLNVVFSSEAEFARQMGKNHDWESQFKILPLYDKIIQRT
jgi:hypothetical protein